MFSSPLSYMIDWPVILILYLSITHGDSHKLVTLMVLALCVLWESGSGHSKFVKISGSHLRDHVVGTDLLGNFLEVCVLVQGALSDWDHCVHHVPKDSLDERSGGKGALVCESPVEINELHKSVKVERTVFWLHHQISMFLLVNKVQ